MKERCASWCHAIASAVSTRSRPQARASLRRIGRQDRCDISPQHAHAQGSGGLLESDAVDVSTEFISSVTDAVMADVCARQAFRWSRCTRSCSTTRCVSRSGRIRWFATRPVIRHWGSCLAAPATFWALQAAEIPNALSFAADLRTRFSAMDAGLRVQTPHIKAVSGGFG